MPKRAAHPSVTALLIILSVMVSLAGCAPHAERDRLRRAEALMESDAKAASAVLDSIRPTALRGEARARYALLRTQADYKNYVPLTSDSLILIATHHYGTRRKTLPAALSQYYLGCTYKDMGRDLDAIDALLFATTLFPDTVSRYYANCCCELGILYIKHQMLDNAISFIDKYKRYGIQESDSLILGYAEYYLGMAKISKGTKSKVKDGLLSLLSNNKINESLKTEAYFLLAKNALYLEKDYVSALNYINHYIELHEDTTCIGDAFSVKGNILYNQEDYDSAYYCYKISLQDKHRDIYSECSGNKHLASIASLMGQGDSAKLYTDKYTELLDSIYAKSHRSEINELIASHTIELHDREMAERHSRQLWILCLLSLVLITGTIISILMVKKRRQDDKLAYQEELAALRRKQISLNIQEDEPMDDANPAITDADCEAASDDSSNVPSPMQPDLSYMALHIGLVRKEFATSCWPKFFVSSLARIQRGEFMRDDKSKDFLSFLDDLFAEVFMHMAFDNAGLSQADLRYCAMVILRLTVDQMAFCTHVSKHSIHCRHARMRDRLTDEWYVCVFGKPKK